MLLSHDEIIDLLTTEVVEYAEPELVNSSSLDIRLGINILVERPAVGFNHDPNKGGLNRVVLRDRTPLNMVTHNLQREGPYVLYPGEFILASTHELFNLPNHISASYALKSSMARIGLEHLNAGWCDAGWHGSVLTLELKNMTRSHEIVLNHLDLIGQMCFFKHKPVAEEHSYACRGRYNKDKTVSGAKQHPHTKKEIIWTDISDEPVDTLPIETTEDEEENAE